MSMIEIEVGLMSEEYHFYFDSDREGTEQMFCH